MFNRIYESMFEGSMVGKGALAFATWSYVLARMKPDRKQGEFYAELNPALISRIFGGCTEQEVSDVIAEFTKPDEASRTTVSDGRKLIKEGQFLYRVVNGVKYNALRSYEQRRLYMKHYMADRRMKAKEKPVTVSGGSLEERNFVNSVNNGEGDGAPAQLS